MTDFLAVLGLVLLPAGGNILGSLVAEMTRVSSWVIGAALHAAAGVAIAVVSVDMMPRVLDTLPAVALVAAFVCGAAFSILLKWGVEWGRRRVAVGSAGAWMVYMAVAADLLSDGLMIGAGAAVSSGLGLLLGLSQVVANVPGGFAAMANFAGEGMRRRTRLMVAASFVLPVLIGAVAGFWGLRGAGEAWQMAALAFVIGILLLATVEDLVPQADELGAARWISTISFTAGFAFFALLSSYIG